MTAQLSMFDLKTWSDTPNATSSQAPASGQSQRGLQDGQTIARSGRAPARASRSARQVAASAPTIRGICGPTSFASSVPAGPLSSWESRLRERLAMVGSTECALIWREKTSPAGQSISRCAPWTAPISASGSTGSPWPTVTTTPKHEEPASFLARRAAIDPSRLMGPTGTLGVAMIGAWATPSVVDATGRGYQMAQGKKFLSLPGQMDERLSGPKGTWSTPRASDGEKGGPNQSFGAGGQPLPSQMHQASPWVTPSARDWKDSAGMAPTAEDGRKRLDQLPRQMAATDLRGPEPTGLSATTARRGAPNPEFAFWLMGWPDEFRRGVLRAIASLPSSRRK